MTSAEFVQWQMFFRIEPFGGLAEDNRAGKIAAMIYNVNRSKGKTPIRPNQIFPSYKPRINQPWQDMLKNVEALNKQMGGKDIRDQKEPQSD